MLLGSIFTLIAFKLQGNLASERTLLIPTHASLTFEQRIVNCKMIAMLSSNGSSCMTPPQNKSKKHTAVGIR